MLGLYLFLNRLLFTSNFKNLIIDLLQLLLVPLLGVSHQLTIAVLDVLALDIEPVPHTVQLQPLLVDC